MIIHIDMDAFYASVEQLDDPGLKGKCVIVGGLSGRGVVSAASYEARKYGVHSAMPMFQARKLCPKGVYLSHRMDRYRQISETIMGLLRSFTPLVEAVSIDEAYMDVTGCRRLFGPPVEIGRQIKQAIRDAVELSCSVGIAPNMFLAKVASDMDKPDGLTVIGESEAREFIKTLPILKVPGVGKKTGGRLAAMGIETLGDVESCCSETLQKRLGRFGLRLKDLSRGVDRSRVTPYTPSKSISSERTLSVDTDEMTLLAKHLLDQAETVSRNLRGENVRAKTVMLKLKYAD